MKELLKSGGVRSRQAHPVLEDDFVKLASPSKPKYFRDLNRQLLDDIYRARLKIFLKCEDRCGMWHGVESRTPFADDHELMELMFSFNGEKKIQHGVSKYLLREAVKDRLPREIYSRYDKKGFETPMNSWLTEMRPLMLDEVKASRLPFVRYDRLDKKFPSNPANDRLLFRMFILSRWKAAFSA